MEIVPGDDLAHKGWDGSCRRPGCRSEIWVDWQPSLLLSQSEEGSVPEVSGLWKQVWPLTQSACLELLVIYMITMLQWISCTRILQLWNAGADILLLFNLSFILDVVRVCNRLQGTVRQSDEGALFSRNGCCRKAVVKKVWRSNMISSDQALIPTECRVNAWVAHAGRHWQTFLKTQHLHGSSLQMTAETLAQWAMISFVDLCTLDIIASKADCSVEL